MHARYGIESDTEKKTEIRSTNSFLCISAHASTNFSALFDRSPSIISREVKSSLALMLIILYQGGMKMAAPRDIQYSIATSVEDLQEALS